MPSFSGLVESYDYKGHTIEIYQDELNTSPCEEEPLGTILYRRGSRYVLGCEEADAEEMEEIASDKNNIVMAVYALVHSGVALSTKAFSDPWDSGQSGIIYISKEDALAAFGRKKMTPKLRAKVKQALKTTVEVMSMYLNGEVYGYVVKGPDGEEIDSLWGMYGFEYAKEQAEEAASG